ncbi:MAG: RNB domain-containing ribonuclease [Gemmatimonadetes bacterium]|nr:RNB domain-containing ribonuclease [Gemmatimonadota bacterium]MYH17811.1 RNB domain-containing ribonuclease [Gemmatimonadota bacterium]MYK99667.1 RNB domain-containing ribonuclease [Gemmatimonadota bacterium]
MKSTGYPPAGNSLDFDPVRAQDKCMKTRVFKRLESERKEHSVHIGDLIIFRHRGDIQIGMLQAVSRKKLKVATSANRVMDISTDPIVRYTDIRVRDLPEMLAVRREIEDQALSFDLEEVWDILKDDSTVFTSEDIGELYWGEPGSPEQRAAMQLHLSRQCLYFCEQDNGFTSRTTDQVRSILDKEARQRAVSTEREGFDRWLADETQQDLQSLTNRQKRWLSHLREYVIQGDEYTAIDQVRSLLKEMPTLAGGDPQRSVFEVMVRKGFWDEDENLDLLRYEIPTGFSDEVLEYAAACRSSESGRVDLTGLPILSIDDASTQDIDDALSAERTEDGYRIGVHITDVADLVPRDSILDLAARERMSSVYLPDRHIPMLPTNLSQDHCALLEGERRCAISFFFTLSSDFELLDSRIMPSLIVNRARLSYDEANRLLGTIEQPYAEVLQILNQAVDVFYQRRIDQGAVDLERSVVSIKVDGEKRIRIVLRDTSTRSEHIVSELMILANRTAAAYLAGRDIPAIYRTQAETDLGDLEQAEHDAVWRFLVLRRMKPLELSLKSRPHATLGVDTYCQITSPIRRYADLVLQRQLRTALTEGPPAYDADEMMDELSALERSRILNKIQARREWYWLLKHLAQQKDVHIRAIVLETRERNILVEFPDFGTRMAVKVEGRPSPGEEIVLSPVAIDPWSGTLRLRQITDHS